MDVPPANARLAPEIGCVDSVSTTCPPIVHV
jgi:hypothetical protein